MRRSSIFANPVLVGAVTVLVVTVAVFLSYNANQGLPFVPTQQLKVRVANGANLVDGNEVRSGGFRVGVVSDMRPVRLEDGEVGAELTLKLDKSIGEIPRDSRFVIRPRSALGLKYLELTEGNAEDSFTEGDTVPADQAHVPVDLDEVYEMFDEDTREGSQAALQGFGDAFTGRGYALGRTVDELPRLFEPLEDVMRNLAAPETELASFFKELGDAARIVAPVSETQARLFTDMADTFEAFGRDEEALKSFIEKSPPTLDVSTDSLRVQRPFLHNFAEFSEDFQPATRELRGALPTLNSALARGIPVQRRAVELNEELGDTMTALEELAIAPGTNPGVRSLTANVDTLNPQLRYYGPTITVCNAFAIFFTYLAEHFSEPDTTGSAQRALLNSAGNQEDSFSSQEANAPANGQQVERGNAQFLKGQDFPHSITEDGEADCESGQRGWLERQASMWPRQLGGANLRIARDPVTPGVQGPTYSGRARVYPGQTFTRNPQTGPYAAGLNRPSEFGGR